MRLILPLTAQSGVEVSVFTVAFRKVNHLNLPGVEPGQSLPLPLADQWGNPLASGIYYVVAQAQGNRWILKLLVIR